jgi:hypothetical protein
MDRSYGSTEPNGVIWREGHDVDSAKAMIQQDPFPSPAIEMGDTAVSDSPQHIVGRHDQSNDLVGWKAFSSVVERPGLAIRPDRPT